MEHLQTTVLLLKVSIKFEISTFIDKFFILTEDKSLSDDQLKLAIQLSLQEPARFRSNDSTGDPDGDKRNNDGSMNSVNSNGSDTMFQSKISDGNPSWSVTRERREIIQQDFTDMDAMRGNRMSEQV